MAKNCWSVSTSGYTGINSQNTVFAFFLNHRTNYNSKIVNQFFFQTLLMDIKYNYPVRFPFNPSTICLEDIEIPEVLKLPMLEKI